jgi:hypothetical protein
MVREPFGRRTLSRDREPVDLRAPARVPALAAVVALVERRGVPMVAPTLRPILERWQDGGVVSHLE